MSNTCKACIRESPNGYIQWDESCCLLDKIETPRWFGDEPSSEYIEPRRLAYKVPSINTGSGEWTLIAKQGESRKFNIPVDLRYGVSPSGPFSYEWNVTGLQTFDNNTFTDPAPGTEKQGWYKNAQEVPVVTGLFNTGVNLVGTVDQAWRLPTLPSELVLASGTPANDTESSWIRVNQGDRPNGETRYELPFSVEGDPTQVALQIHVISDGTVTDIKINGTSSGFVATADFHWTDPIVILYGFANSNVIQFNLKGNYFRCKIEQVPRPPIVPGVSRFFSTADVLKNNEDQNYVNVNIGTQPNSYPILLPVLKVGVDPYQVNFGGYYGGGAYTIPNVPGFPFIGATFGTGRIRTSVEVSDPTIATVSFRFQGDADLNFIVGIYLNGVNTGVPVGVYTLNGPTITIATGFVVGYNTLEIDTLISGTQYSLAIQKL